MVPSPEAPERPQSSAAINSRILISGCIKSYLQLSAWHNEREQNHRRYRQCQRPSNYLKGRGKQIAWVSCSKGYPAAFTGGTLQRICISMALTGGSRILVSDEPTL